MKAIKIKSLKIVNFKGIKNLEIKPKDHTDIFGANATGKTSVFDAFTWGLFDKDSKGNSSFNIKRLDEQGRTSDKTEVSVEMCLSIDGEDINLKKVLKEKWVKKRGSLTSEFTGNITDYYWDEVPVKKNEYDKNVADILVEDIFKMITNPLVFTSLNWREQRAKLIEIVGVKSNADLAKGNEAFENLVKKVSTKKTLEQYEAQIKASIAKAKKDIKAIPDRIDEVERNKPEQLDFDLLESTLKAREKDLFNTESKLENANQMFQSQIEKQRELYKEKSELENEMTDIKISLRSKAKSSNKELHSNLESLETKRDRLSDEVKSHRSDYFSNQDAIEARQKRITYLNDEMQKLREVFAKKSNETLKFNDDDFKCPTCHRIHEDGDIESKKEQMLKNFNLDKSKKLEEINQKGAEHKADKEFSQKALDKMMLKKTELKQLIESKSKEVEDISGKITDLNNELNKPNTKWEYKYEILLSENDQLKKLQEDVDLIDQKIEKTLIKDESSDELREEKKQILKEIENIKSQLHAKDEIKRADERINELSDLEKSLAQSIADVEKDQWLIEEFTKLKINDLESRVNDLFELVDFKLFETQINGGVKQTCEATVNGVPFSDVNTASKINAGLSIINTLCDHYKVNAPIFIDNRESITDIIETDSQIINLIVSDQDKKLKIETKY